MTTIVVLYVFDGPLPNYEKGLRIKEKEEYVKRMSSLYSLISLKQEGQNSFTIEVIVPRSTEHNVAINGSSDNVAGEVVENSYQKRRIHLQQGHNNIQFRLKDSLFNSIDTIHFNIEIYPLNYDSYSNSYGYFEKRVTKRYLSELFWKEYETVFVEGIYYCTPSDAQGLRNSRYFLVGVNKCYGTDLVTLSLQKQ